ncbi:hypothetical protein TWF696_006933 [Orbilia brochopaga]|uniref:Uncharacterized protein n=1 Tax=Orbilia brochopaga TaxID=3140254 RepID=A0AAV9UTP8_9PEZI
MHLPLVLLAGLLGLQALAGPVPVASNNQITTFRHSSHEEDSTSLRQLAGTILKRSIANAPWLHKREAGNEVAKASLVARADAQNNRMIKLSPEELAQLQSLVRSHQQLFTISDVQSPVAKAVLLFIFICCMIAGCVLMMLPAGLLI